MCVVVDRGASVHHTTRVDGAYATDVLPRRVVAKPAGR